MGKHGKYWCITNALVYVLHAMMEYAKLYQNRSKQAPVFEIKPESCFVPLHPYLLLIVFSCEVENLF